MSTANTSELERVLRQSRAIDQLTTGDRDELMRHMTEVIVPAGTTVFRQGEAGDTLLLVVDGVLTVYFDSEKTRTKLRDVRRGEFLGEMSVLDPAPRSATIITDTNCTLYSLQLAQLDAR